MSLNILLINPFSSYKCEFNNEKKIVDKPYYKLNYLFESENKTFYDIKTSIFGEKIATVELPHDVLQ